MNAVTLNPPVPLSAMSFDVVLRLGGAGVAGLLLGLDRELRGYGAGLRTNAVVCFTSALLAVTAIALFHALSTTTSRIDPLRAIEGSATVIGVVAAATVFRDGGTRNLTTAFQLWLVAVIGLAFGGGLYPVALAGTAGALLLVSALRMVERKPFGRGDDGQD